VRAVATATGTSHQAILRFEHGEIDTVRLEDLGAWSATVGMDLVLRLYPAGDPIRDAQQQRLLHRLRPHIHQELVWRTEVTLPNDADLRAWDAVIGGHGWSLAVEAETAITDVQATERRLMRKMRDGRIDQVILLVADTRRNRRALDSAPAAFGGFSRNARAVLAALRAGADPGRAAIVFL
jgi:hypothetical protein